MYYRWGNSLRQGRRINPVVQNGTTQFGFHCLFNNDSTKYIGVLDFAFSEIDANGTSGFVIQKAQIGSSQLVALPIVTDDPTPPGLSTTGTVTVLPTFTTFIFGYLGGYLGSFHNYPFAVLRPGWSITAYASTATATLYETMFFWEWCWPDELTNPKIGDPAVDY